MEEKTVYRECFSTAAGKKVLASLMMQSGYFDSDIETPEEQAVQNFVKEILKTMGMTSIDNVQQYVNGLFELKA